MPSDDILIETYVEVDTPTDQLALHAHLRKRFVDALGVRTQEPVQAEQAVARLIYLRRTGHLPRLRRKRNAS